MGPALHRRGGSQATAPVLAYAAVFEVAGKYNWIALHAVALVWTLGTMAGLYVIGRQLFNRETGLIAALLYSVFQPQAG